MLYHAFVPFLKNGGLFIPTNKAYNLGEEVFIVLNLMTEPDKLPVAGAITWITPKGPQGNQAAGIGVHFSDLDDSGAILRSKIENHLVDKKADKATHTM
jgi:type IV pilus assembly protein PilZ